MRYYVYLPLLLMVQFCPDCNGVFCVHYLGRKTVKKAMQIPTILIFSHMCYFIFRIRISYFHLK